MTNSKEQINNQIRSILNTAKIPEKEKSNISNDNLSIHHIDNSNIQVNQAESIIINQYTTKRVIKKTRPQKGTIANNAFIVDNIKQLCKKVIDARIETKITKNMSEEEVKEIKSKVSRAFNAKFNKDFGVNSRAAIYNFSENRANEIINYLQKLYANTKKGRIENKAKSPDYKHNVGHYFRIEQELLEKLGKTSKDDDLVDLRFRLFNVNSRKELSIKQWEIYIDFLNQKLDNMFN